MSQSRFKPTKPFTPLTEDEKQFAIGELAARMTPLQFAAAMDDATAELRPNVFATLVPHVTFLPRNVRAVDYRKPQRGEYFLLSDRTIFRSPVFSEAVRDMIILEPAEGCKWRYDINSDRWNAGIADPE